VTLADPEQLTDFVRSLARNKVRQGRFSFWLCSWLLFLCLPLYGIDRDQKLADLYHTAWTFKDGARQKYMPWPRQQTVFCGSGLQAGWFRFDGIRFEPYEPPNP